MNDTALLLSGGMDSTALAWAIRPGLAITIDYGQRAAAGELRAASAICEALGIRRRIIQINCAELGSGDMVGDEPAALAPVPEWWPFRNQLLLTLSGAVAIQESMATLAFGAVSTDSSHADGRIEFFEAMQTVFALQEGAIRLEAPAVRETTVALCRRVKVPFDVLAWCHSCHVSEYACGRCRGCRKHRATMRELGYGEY